MPGCPNCGEENPERARFCWSCGAALVAEPKAAAAEERKIAELVWIVLRAGDDTTAQACWNPRARGRTYDAAGRFQEARSLFQNLGAAPSVSLADEALARATSVSA